MLFHLTPKRDGWYVLTIALLFAANLFAPAFALIPGAGGANWVYLCGSVGNRYVLLEEGKQTPPAPLPSDHCPFCSLYKLHGLAPGSGGIPEPAVRLAAVLPGWPLLSVRLASAPADHARPRAPPFALS